MIQSINLDDDLIAQATQLSDAGDLNGVIEMALREYIDRRQRLKIVDLFGTIDYDESFDYKVQRCIVPALYVETFL